MYSEGINGLFLLLAVVITAGLLLLPRLLCRPDWAKDPSKSKAGPDAGVSRNARSMHPGASEEAIIAHIREVDDVDKELTWFRLSLARMTVGVPIGFALFLIFWIRKDFMWGVEIGAMSAVIIALLLGAFDLCRLGVERMRGLPRRFYFKPLLLLPLAAVGCYFFTKYVGYPLLIKFFQGWDKLLDYSADYSQGLPDCPFERAFITSLIFVLGAWLSTFHRASCFRYWIPLLISYALPALVGCFIMIPIAFVVFCLLAAPILGLFLGLSRCLFFIGDSIVWIFGFF